MNQSSRPWIYWPISFLQTKVQTVSDEELKTHDGQAQDTKKQDTPGQKQPETEESTTSVITM